MADTPTPGETEGQEPLKNDAGQPTTPQTEEKKSDNAEVEAARREAEQAKMRANQLLNELNAKNEAEAKAKQAELEKQNEFKTLYEQKQAELDALKSAQEAEEKRRTVAELTSSTLGEFSDDVKALAEDAGLKLEDDSDEAVQEYRSKLEKFQTRLGSQRVMPSNPPTTTPNKAFSREEMHEILNDPAKRDAYYRAKNGITAQMMDKPQS